ncbi:MAG TPA: hypothetical protein VFO60_12250 [Candidatus Dormibacteraeota bacterium]|nr:hypothetical protein [Candidatus Dormibacteraeota bacterium]
MLDRLTQADRFAAGGAALAVVAALLPWYRFDDGANRVTLNAFGTGFWGDVVFLCAAATLFVVLVRRDVVSLGVDLSDRRVDGALGATALAGCVLQLLIGVNGSGAFHSATVGILVALAACAAMAAGAWMRGGETARGRVAARG